jgi:hypothetical protein
VTEGETDADFVIDMVLETVADPLGEFVGVMLAVA